MDYGLTPDTIESVQQCLLANNRIEQVILYGSRAKGNYRPGSDIDVVLKGSRLTLQDVYRLEECLDDLLLPYQFDISLYHHIENPDLIEHIRQVGLLFYETKAAIAPF